jgi:polyprenyl-phospho-N-acetylgalactosaminyl synthase
MQPVEAKSVWVVIAAYNEASVIGSVIADVRRFGYQVVLVDDGSSDTTMQIAEHAGAQVVRHVVNLGQGAALQTGIEFSLQRGADFIVTFDGDGQHRVADIGALLDALAEHGIEYALGSRFLGQTIGLRHLRRVLLEAATWFTRVTSGLAVSDTHNGLRAMTRRGASAIRLRQNRMAHASEILNHIAASGYRYVEVPVMIEYNTYSLGKGQKLSGALSILVDLVARRLHR